MERRVQIQHLHYPARTSVDYRNYAETLEIARSKIPVSWSSAISQIAVTSPAVMTATSTQPGTSPRSLVNFVNNLPNISSIFMSYLSFNSFFVFYGIRTSRPRIAGKSAITITVGKIKNTTGTNMTTSFFPANSIKCCRCSFLASAA